MNRLEGKSRLEYRVGGNSGWLQQVASCPAILKRSLDMVRRSMLSLAAILSASALMAQSPATVQKSFGVSGQTSGQSQTGANSPSVFVLLSPAASACPVSMRAEHRSGGGVITTGKSQIIGPMQHIHLILGQVEGLGRVTAATVTVRGTNGKWRTMNASQFQTQPQPGSPYISSTLNVVFVRDGDDAEYSDLDLPGFTSVKSIRLDSVTYADGSI
jgi:hypothetical protein